MKETGVQLKLTMVDTPGFGDAVDNSNWSVLCDCGQGREERLSSVVRAERKGCPLWSGQRGKVVQCGQGREESLSSVVRAERRGCPV